MPNGLVRVSEDPPVGTVLPPTTCGLHHCLTFFIGPVFGSAHGNGLFNFAAGGLVIFCRKMGSYLRLGEGR